MSYKVLYRLYRPRKLEDVVGQKYIVKTLQNALIKKKVANAYLFCGPRGTGKTSVAKILANSLNCLSFNGNPCGQCSDCQEILAGSHPDVIEFDAASHSRVENIRDILDQVNYAPTLGSYKIYIIDEVHMLSNAAANALLKTLEEPPSNVVFILATTEVQKVLPTIQSRCQRYDFAKIEKHDLITNMINILNNEKIEYENEALEIVANLAEGGMRDALSILEQCLAYGENKLLTKDVKEIYGLVSTQDLLVLLKEIFTTKTSRVIQHLRDIANAGADINHLTLDLLNICKENLIYCSTNEKQLLEILSSEQASELLKIANQETILSLLTHLQQIMINNQNIDALSNLEIAILKFMSNFNEESKEIQTTEKSIRDKEAEKLAIKVDEKLNNEDNSLTQTETLSQEIDIKEDTKQKDLLYTYEQLGSYLLAATKEEKQKIENVLENKLDEYAYDINYRKFYSTISNVEIFGASSDFILVSCEKEIAERINEEDYNKELYFFFKDILKLDKMIYAISINEIDEVKKAFFDCQSKKIKATKPIKYIEPIINSENDDKEKKLSELFGDKLVIEDK